MILNCRDLANKFLEELLLNFTSLDFANLATNNLTHPKFHLILYTIT